MREKWEDLNLYDMDAEALKALREEVEAAYEALSDKEFADEDSPEYYAWLDQLDRLEELMEDIEAAMEG